VEGLVFPRAGEDGGFGERIWVGLVAQDPIRVNNVVPRAGNFPGIRYVAREKVEGWGYPVALTGQPQASGALLQEFPPVFSRAHGVSLMS